MVNPVANAVDGRTPGGELDVRELGHRYGANDILAGIDLTVRPGEFISLVGPSGVGKTTLLRCLSGLQRPADGQVRYRGVPLTEPVAGVAVVFQDYSRSLLPWSSVVDNVALPLRSAGRSKQDSRELARAALAEVGLGSVDPRAYPWQLSGGMQQRVAIARALVYRPSLVLMDEPFASVDAQTRADLEDLVRRLHGELGLSVVLVTHDMDEAVYMSDRVVVLNGKPATIATVLDIDLGATRDQVATKSTARFAQLRSEVYRIIHPASSAVTTSAR
ncbi:ABC transporter ATP-binding protein [Kutzneria sp. NPDC051319]|uniref:ABC transporter ATP-binding protein n=1 Tax=Kutzneria sp. NPDC051319 TaxID=3155047 RepID=UPI00341733CE